jgi:allantoate deiminase
VIAARAEVSLDVRHPVDARRRLALRGLRARGRAIARGRGLSFSLEVTQDNAAVRCSPELTRVLAQSVRERQGRCPALASGAGHDAVIVSRIAPVAMLFVRCRGGLSHHPDESVRARDLAAALRITVGFLRRMAARRAR